MSGPIEGSQNELEELGKFNQVQWNKFVEGSINKEKKELKTAEEKSKTNKGKSIEILEKHFHDRTLQPLSEFREVGKKEVGCSSGFQAEHQYKDDKATFMIKSILNHTLTEKEKQSKLEQFKESYYRGTRKVIKLQNSNLKDSQIDDRIDPYWQQAERDICYDDLNVADFIREYTAGDLYKLLLHDRAPIVELVTNNDLPEKRFKRDEMHKDQFKEHIEQEKKQDKLYLRSKFLDKFTTLMDLKEKGENYQDASGFEKILAAQILLGEVDIAQSENFGVIEKEYENAKGEKVKEKLWAKIDHGRSFYLSFSDAKNYLQNFCFFLLQLRSYGIKIDLGKLSKELGRFIDYYDKNKEKFEALIDKKTSSLNHILNSNMKFELRYMDESGLHRRNFKCIDREFKSQEVHFLLQTVLNNSPSTNLSSYFKQRLETQVGMARNLAGALKSLDKVEKTYSYVVKPSFCLFVPTLIAAIFTSGTVGTAFTVAAVVTGTCMLIGIVTSICLYVYALNSCNSNIRLLSKFM
ncbi:hypothetical protein [Wolbachia endosymbiont (group A) of Anomoia purmunda]|uniref:hypothetical protein n=1 Tax=Wolbachia endosymbiont (group A) of Anomoia purmunda TaxID=2953978 RepID=UPI00222F2870|nr:hypothetical protein [Wolbachia endosymbiont (group A) of Anomoia purmunda]